MSGLVVPLGGVGPWTGGPVTASATCVLAGNPGPMTLDGTNTWVLRVPGETVALVVDPGPALPAHLAAMEAALDGARVVRVLLTHGHPDHAEGAADFAARVHAPVAALDPAHRLGDEGLVDGDVIRPAASRWPSSARPGTRPTR